MDVFQKLKVLCDTFERVATEQKIPICVTTVDDHGDVVLLQRMPGAPILSLEMAERKAYTAVVMGCETAALGPQIQPGQPLYSLTSSSTRLIAFGGGSRVQFGDTTFGVGISGGTTEQDMAILRAGRSDFSDGDWASEFIE
jgi:cob(I)alamin adenosyltransferase